MTTRSLPERLRSNSDLSMKYDTVSAQWRYGESADLMREAAARIEELGRERDGLREALHAVYHNPTSHEALWQARSALVNTDNPPTPQALKDQEYRVANARVVLRQAETALSHALDQIDAEQAALSRAAGGEQ